MFRASIVGLAAVLAGCAHDANFERPAMPVPQEWATMGTSQPATPLHTHWRQFFPDPQLQALIAAALDNNRDLRMAAARVEEARAQYGLARADRSPTLGLNASASATQLPADLSGTGAVTTGERYDLSLASLSFELDFWGRIAGLSEAARYSVLATEEARRTVQLSLVADVAGSYFALQQAREQVQASGVLLESRKQSLAVVQKGKDIGGAFDLELQNASNQMEAARSALDGARHQVNVANNRLNFLVGTAVLPVIAPVSLDQQGLDVQLPDGLSSDVLLQRPDVIAAERRLRAAHANIDVARAAFFPKVLLTATMGVASQGLATLFSSGGAWSFLPSLTMPLFDGGRAASGVDLAQARKVVAVADYEKTIQAAFRDVADLMSSRTTLARQYRSVQNQVRSQERLLQMARARYNAGLVGYLEVLESERELVSAQQYRGQIRRAQLDSAAQLFKALGGGAQLADT
jgi:multidrug efflux system outer membrane protein